MRIGFQVLRIGLVVLSAMALAACGTEKPMAHNGGLVREQNEGYSLLYKLMSDNSGVDKVFVIKHADEPMAGVIKQIAVTCQTAKKQMEDWPKGNPHIEFDVQDLPKLEEAARKSESSAEAKSLLLSSGKTFETRLIFNEVEAMGYARNLCEALVAKEADPARKDFLTGLSKQCSDFHDRLLDMLIVK